MASGKDKHDPSNSSMVLEDLGGRIDRVIGSLTRLLERGAWVGGLGVLLLLPLPYLLGVSNLSSFGLGLFFCGLALLLVRVEPKSYRCLLLSLFAWSYLVRLFALLVVSWVLFPGEGTFLGSDAQTYFRQSQFLAANNLSFGTFPVTVLGTYDLAHYYLFASTLYIFKGDLFTLQLLNSGLGALVSLLTFSWCRLVVPRYAVPIGVIVALHPSLIALSAKDLLKDPSVLFFTVLAVWSVTKLLQRESVPSLVGFAFAGLVALMYIRMDRFYVFVYLELAAVCVLLLHLLRRVPIFQGNRRGAAAVLFVFAVAEIGPMTLGWPLSLNYFYFSIKHVLVTPDIRYYAVGLLDRLGLPGVITIPADLFRKVFGPFVWVLPQKWDVPYILAGDFLLIPGMVIWYVLLPFLLVGLATLGFGVVQGRDNNPILVALWVFLLMYFGQYLAITLSTRHREVMLPLLLPFVFMGLKEATQRHHWKALYAAYWTFIASVAAIHTLMR